MNQTIQDILERRSIRSYTEEQISDADLDLIIKAGQYAPSANNKQPWHFTVIQDHKLLNELNSETKQAFFASENPFLRKIGENEDFNVFNGAPTVIVLSGDAKNPNSPTDCSIAGENMMLAAKSLGIGSCFTESAVYLLNNEEADYFCNKLGIPSGYKAISAILFGYSALDENPEAPARAEGTVNYIR